MTSTFVPPLEIKHDKIDPAILQAVRRINEAAGKCDTKYFLAGATAREIMLRHVFGRGPGRRTRGRALRRLTSPVSAMPTLGASRWTALFPC